MRLSSTRTLAFLLWAAAVVVLIWLAWIWRTGALNVSNLLVTFAASLSLGLLGVLQLSGDLSVRRQDEGQRAAAREAQSVGFFVGYLGLLTLWLGYLAVPSWQAAASVHVGILVVLVLVAYLGRLAWIRWRG
jgi:hypothetical protein